MKAEYFGHIRRSTTLFPQRICKSPEPTQISSSRDGFNLESRKEIFQNISKKNNEIFCIEEPQDTIIKTENIEDVCEVSSNGVSEQTEAELIMCFVCRKEIVYEYLSEHLLIGQVECIKCSTVFTNCKYFQEWAVEREFGMSSCDHDLQYLDNPWETLNICFSIGIGNISLSVTEEIKNRIAAYLKLIKSLENRYPWKEIFSSANNSSKIEGVPLERTVLKTNVHKCSEVTPVNSYHNIKSSDVQICKENESLTSEIYIISEGDAVNSSTTETNTKNSSIETITVATDDGLTDIKQNHCSTKTSADHLFKIQKRKSKANCIASKRTLLSPQSKKPAKFIETPTDGFYYITKYSVKECPNCYNDIKPEDFAVNIVTFLITAICSDCGLAIYIVEDSMHDLKSQVYIVTDSKSLNKKQ